MRAVPRMRLLLLASCVVALCVFAAPAAADDSLVRLSDAADAASDRLPTWGEKPASDPTAIDAQPAAYQRPSRGGGGYGGNGVPANPYRQLAYDNDFSYVETDGPFDRVDQLKRIPVGPGSLELGAAYRLRYHHQRNQRLDGRSNDYLLHRTRAYLHYRTEDVRVFAELIDAVSELENLPPRAPEENRFDAVNLFLDARLVSNCCGDHLTARVGRQEMIYGTQRLVASRPWRNTTVTHDGARMISRYGKLTSNVFWVRPIDNAQHPGDDTNFDSPDQSREFMGWFSTWKPQENQTFDFYFLRFAEYDPLVLAENGQAGDFDANTFGARWSGRRDNWLWELEGGYQFGEFSIDPQSAGFFTVGAGYDFAEVCGAPKLWLFFDWASGDKDPTDNRRGTFNQITPRGHYYLGWADVTGRQNIQDLNLRLDTKLHEDVSLRLWAHRFWLAQSRDAMYGVGGGVRRRDATGAAGRDVGTEIDLAITWRMQRHVDLQFGHAHVFAGDFLARTGNGDDIDFFYTRFRLLF